MSTTDGVRLSGFFGTLKFSNDISPRCCRSFGLTISTRLNTDTRRRASRPRREDALIQYMCAAFSTVTGREDAEVVFVGARQRYGARASSHPAACDHAAVPLSGTRSTCVATTAAPAIQ